ncbi:hypothetical protein AURDEDRAFT_118939 [Auricularia subglabra TFB-10046 SS5]|nr:hypothetical protein AURDEDRAFT_118939 [Auricularia subglabra TFB-10046 SS5]
MALSPGALPVPAELPAWVLLWTPCCNLLSRHRRFPIDPRTAASFMLAGCVIQLYEWLITSGDELERIWLAEWTGFTAFWFLVRYVPIVARVLGADPSNCRGHPSCARFSRTPPIFFGLSLVLAHFALLLRVHAVWERRLAVLILPLLLWLAEVAMSLIPVFQPSAIAKPIPGVPGCAVSPGPKEARLLSITIACGVAFDVVTSVLVLARCVSYWRQSMRGPLLSMLLVHSAGYFVVVLVLGGVNLIFILGAIENLPAKLFWLMLATTVPSIAVNRMLLSLRAFVPATESTATTRQAESRSIKLTLAFGINTVMNSFDGMHGRQPQAAPLDETQIELQHAALP